MKKALEQGLMYKTFRISYVTNYILAGMIAVILLLIFPMLDIYKNILHFALFFVLLIVAAGLCEEPELERVFRKYFITNNEVVKLDGLIRRKRMVIPYQSVADIKVAKGVFGRIFNFGDVDISGFKEGFIMKGMKNPEEIQNIIQAKVNLMRAKVIKEGKFAANV